MELFEEGKTIEEICSIRQLQPNTIIAHLQKNGCFHKYPYTHFMKKEEFDTIQSVFYRFGEKCSIHDIRPYLPASTSSTNIYIAKEYINFNDCPKKKEKKRKRKKKGKRDKVLWHFYFGSDDVVPAHSIADDDNNIWWWLQMRFGHQIAGQIIKTVSDSEL